MAYRTTYFIPWTGELDVGNVHFESDLVLEVAVTVDRSGDVAQWKIVSVGDNTYLHGYQPATDDRGILAGMVAKLQADADGSLDARVCRAVDEDDDAPRPRSDRQEHGTLYHGGVL